MTLQETIEKCDKLKPNQYDEKEKTDWINELELRVVRDILQKHEGYEEYVFMPYETGEEAVLIVPEPYSDLYIKFLFCQIDLYNAEIDRYNNSAALFNAAFSDYQLYFRRTHMPIQHPAVIRTGIKPYGNAKLAVKRISTAAGKEVSVGFTRIGNKFLVKNFSEGDIYVAFSTPVDRDASILIRPDTYQNVMIGERFDYDKTAVHTIYILPEADSENGVEVQLIVV